MMELNTKGSMSMDRKKERGKLYSVMGQGMWESFRGIRYLDKVIIIGLMERNIKVLFK